MWGRATEERKDGGDNGHKVSRYEIEPNSHRGDAAEAEGQGQMVRYQGIADNRTIAQQMIPGLGNPKVLVLRPIQTTERTGNISTDGDKAVTIPDPIGGRSHHKVQELPAATSQPARVGAEKDPAPTWTIHLKHVYPQTLHPRQIHPKVRIQIHPQRPNLPGEPTKA